MTHHCASELPSRAIPLRHSGVSVNAQVCGGYFSISLYGSIVAVPAVQGCARSNLFRLLLAFGLQRLEHFLGGRR